MTHRTTPIETASLPPGIPYIIGNEIAERFSFYGMRTILVVFMMQYLPLMDGLGGRQISGNEAVEHYHQFTSWVYFTPLLGALLADIFLGKYRTILVLSIVYCLGHAALACMGTFGHSAEWLRVGLLLICLGAGGIKPCVSAHVGDQFGKKNHHLLSRVYGWFYFSINFGSFFSTFLTPWLLVHHGPHWAFGVPGVLMALATFMFWLGRHRFVHIPPSGLGFFQEILSRDGLIALAKLVPLFTFIAVFWALYDQTGSSWILQAQQMDLKFLGFSWLESQVQAVNPILILVFIPLFTFVIYPCLHRVFPLTPLRKIGLGLVLITASFALTTAIQTWIDAGQRPSIGWQIAAFAIITASEIMVSVVGLEFAYTQAPRAMKSWIMSLFFLSVWGGNQFTAQVNHYIDIPSAAATQFAAAGPLQAPSGTLVLPGFDAVTGTSDDFLVHHQQGRIDTLVIPGREIFHQAANRIEAAATTTFPTKEAGQTSLNGLLDPWGSPLIYTLIDSTHVRISSAGPDRIPKTPWDIGLTLEKVSPQTPAAAATWLSHRKAELGIRDKPTPAGFLRSEFSGGQSRLEGAAYFRFFTWLIFIATLGFLPFAHLYRPKSYLHD